MYVLDDIKNKKIKDKNVFNKLVGSNVPDFEEDPCSDCKYYVSVTFDPFHHDTEIFGASQESEKVLGMVENIDLVKEQLLH